MDASKGPRVFLALDKMDMKRALELVRWLRDDIVGVKVHDLVEGTAEKDIPRLKDTGDVEVLWDLKLHDTPDTVLARARSAKECGADGVTIHVAGEFDMMYAALDSGISHVFGITQLTSLTTEMVELGSGASAKASVLSRARMAALAGLRGVVCSAKEVEFLNGRRRHVKSGRKLELDGLNFLVPGTRSAGKDTHDQQRSDTSFNAIKNGADYLVIGREVTQADDPILALANINEQIAAALSETA